MIKYDKINTDQPKKSEKQKEKKLLNAAKGIYKRSISKITVNGKD